MIDPGDRRDGGPVGADFGVWVLVCKGATGILPTCSIGPSVQSRVRATFVRVQPAGVEVT